MYSRFPLSMENIPRPTGFLCLSLKFGCVLAAFVHVLYSTLGLAACAAGLADLDVSYDNLISLICLSISGVFHAVSFVLSIVLLLGLLKDSVRCIRPWILWSTFQVLARVSLFIVIIAVQLLNHSLESFDLYFVQLAIIVVMMYTLVLVASYYKELEEPKDKKTELVDGKELVYVQL